MQSGVNRVGHQKIDGRDKSSNAGKSGESTQHTTHTRLHCSTPFSQQSVSERERERRKDGTWNWCADGSKAKSSAKQLLDLSRYIQHPPLYTLPKQRRERKSQNGSSYRVREEEPSTSLLLSLLLYVLSLDPFFWLYYYSSVLTSLYPPSGCCLRLGGSWCTRWFSNSDDDDGYIDNKRVGKWVPCNLQECYASTIYIDTADIRS